MGRSHALSGWCAGLAAAPLLGLDTIVAAVPFAAATAGYAMLPDLDHPGARASRLLGPVTIALSRVIRAFSATLYQATKGPRDEKVTGKHRHATHTLAAAMLLSGLAAVAVAAGGPWAIVGILVVGFVLAVDVLETWLLALLLGAGALWVSAVVAGGLEAAVARELTAAGEWIAIAVGLGMIVHVLGDSATVSGAPWLWPLRIAGETWYEIRPPKGLRFRTGGPFERVVVVPVLTGLAMLLLPGVWPVVASVAETVTVAVTDSLPT